MAEPMHARASTRPPGNRRPRIPHPHLAPPPARPEPAGLSEDGEAATPPSGTGTGGWTRVDIPLVRPSSRSRRGSNRPSPAERALRTALHVGLIVNLAVLLASRQLPSEAFGGWSYGGDDFLLAAAVLLSGYALLAAGRLSRRDDGES